jgi:putative transposon-encoded protein
MELIPGETVTAVCPLNRVGLHERSSGDFSIGEKRAFHVRRVDPVFLHGTPRLKVVVDRVSKTLVETLLKEQIGFSARKMMILCTKRYVGQKSFVIVSRRIPKSAIIAVTQELNEHMQVRVDRNL